LIDIVNATKNKWLLQRKTKARVLSILRICSEVRLSQHFGQTSGSATHPRQKCDANFDRKHEVIGAANNACSEVCIDSTVKNTAPIAATFFA
jgi:hypothetical protein